MTAPAPSPTVLADFEESVRRRALREPLQHVTGVAPFWRVELAVGPGVFIPRPETELLTQWALEALQEVSRPVVVDLCAGSGAVAKAIAHERPDATVYAVEREPNAVEWLRRNLEDCAVTVAADAVDPATLAQLDGGCDAVLANPPYVPDSVAVSVEVAADPAGAVFGGEDGLEVIRPLTRRCAALVRSGGAVAIEHDESHPAAVLELLESAGLTEATSHKDLAGRFRFATARGLRAPR